MRNRITNVHQKTKIHNVHQKTKIRAVLIYTIAPESVALPLRRCWTFAPVLDIRAVLIYTIAPEGVERNTYQEGKREPRGRRDGGLLRRRAPRERRWGQGRRVDWGQGGEWTGDWGPICLETKDTDMWDQVGICALYLLETKGQQMTCGTKGHLGSTKDFVLYWTKHAQICEAPTYFFAPKWHQRIIAQK